MIVTGIELQKNNKERVNIFIDDEFAFGMFIDTAYRHFIVGNEYTEEEIETAKIEGSYYDCLGYATRVLSKTTKTIPQMREKFIEREYPDVAIEKVINRLIELGMLMSNEEYARAWVHSRMNSSNPKSKRAIVQELRLKGISPEISEREVAKIDEFAIVEQLAQKQAPKYKKYPRYQAKGKMYQYLAGKGFNSGVVSEVIGRMNLGTDSGEDYYA